MYKKNLKNPQSISSRQANDHNSNKNSQIKQFSSPSKKLVNTGSNLMTKYKNQVPSTTSKLNQQNQEHAQGEIASNLQVKGKQQNYVGLGMSQKGIKKTNQQLVNSENGKKFSKTNKIPTLKSTTAKGTSDEQQNSLLKSNQDRNEIEQTLSPSNSVNKIVEQSIITISSLKTEVQTLRIQNEQLKKQNEKLAKKIEKLKSVSDQNKKLLKQRIQSFNNQGQTLKKFKTQVNNLQIRIQQLNKQIRNLHSQNQSFKKKIQIMQIPKIFGQIQTINSNQGLIDQNLSVNDKIQQKQKQNQDTYKITQSCKLQQNYQSTSSRQSFGGILPLETVIKQGSKIKINFKTKEVASQQLQNPSNSLAKRYEHYWSSKITKNIKQKSVELKTDQQKQVNNKFQVKSQCFGIQRNKTQLQNQQKQYRSVTINFKRDKKSDNIQGQYQQELTPQQQQYLYEKVRNQIIQQNKLGMYRQNIVDNPDENKNIFSPTILIQNYKKISEQQELIKTLYRVIQQLSKELESAKSKIASLNHKVNIAKKQEAQLQTNDAQNKYNKYQNNNQVGNHNQDEQTLLLDQTISKNIAKDKTKQSKKITTFTNNLDHNKTNIKIQQITEQIRQMSEQIQQIKQQIQVEQAKDQIKQIDKQINNLPKLQKINEQNNFFKNEQNEKPFQLDILRRNNKSQKNTSKNQTINDENMMIDDISRFVHSEIVFRQINFNLQETNFNIEKNQTLQQNKGKLNKQKQQGIRNKQVCENSKIMQDSLQVLQYFSNETPDNISSDISKYKIQPKKCLQKHKSTLIKNNNNELRKQKQDKLFSSGKLEQAKSNLNNFNANRNEILIQEKVIQNDKIFIDELNKIKDQHQIKPEQNIFPQQQQQKQLNNNQNQSNQNRQNEENLLKLKLKQKQPIVNQIQILSFQHPENQNQSSFKYDMNQQDQTRSNQLEQMIFFNDNVSNQNSFYLE